MYYMVKINTPKICKILKIEISLPILKVETDHHLCLGPGQKEFEWGMKIFKHIMLGHETNFNIVIGLWKNP